jgi:hypothetical protein
MMEGVRLQRHGVMVQNPQGANAWHFFATLGPAATSSEKFTAGDFVD